MLSDETKVIIGKNRNIVGKTHKKNVYVIMQTYLFLYFKLTFCISLDF